jgi:hypothetical protein
MKTYTQAQQQASVELQTEPPDVPAPVQMRDYGADAARSEENILQWMSYLPEDCVETMIQMSWDVTT